MLQETGPSVRNNREGKSRPHRELLLQVLSDTRSERDDYPRNPFHRLPGAHKSTAHRFPIVKEVPERVRPSRHAQLPLPLAGTTVGGVFNQQRGELVAPFANRAKRRLRSGLRTGATFERAGRTKDQLPNRAAGPTPWKEPKPFPPQRSERCNRSAGTTSSGANWPQRL